MSTSNLYLLSWNVRGLNQPIRREAVRDMVNSTIATVVCLQETKVQDIDNAMVRETLGNQFQGNYSFLPANGSRGGILIAVSERYFSALEISFFNQQTWKSFHSPFQFMV